MLQKVRGVGFEPPSNGAVSRKLPFFLGFVCLTGNRCVEASTMSGKNEVKCPECGSRRVWKDGVRYTRAGEVQRYLCRECCRRFSC